MTSQIHSEIVWPLVDTVLSYYCKYFLNHFTKTVVGHIRLEYWKVYISITIFFHTWKSNWRYEWFKIWETTDYGHSIKPFFIELPNFWVWADKFWGIWCIFGQFIRTHFGTVGPLSMFSINQPYFLPKTKPLCPNPKYLFVIWIWVAKN